MASNTMEWRLVRRGRTAADGGVIWEENVCQVRTKDTIISILGVSLGSWSAWEDMPPAQAGSYIYQDYNGNPL